MHTETPQLPTLPAGIPDPSEFRAWLRAAVDLHRITITALSRDLGLSKNTLPSFLNTPAAGLRLETAAATYRYLIARPLPPVEPAPETEGGACDGD